MRKLILAVVATALLSPWSWAEPTQAPAAKTIFDYKQELGLSDAQIAAMKEELVNLGNSVKASKAKLTQLEKEYRAMLGQNPSVEQVKAKLDQIAEATTAMRLNDFQVSRKITGTLSEDQLKKWHDIQNKLRAKPQP